MFRKQKEQEVVLVFDVGSASVGGALVLLSKKDKPRIIYNERKQILFQENLDTKEFISSIYRVLNDLAYNIEKKGLTNLNFLKLKDKRIKKSFCFFSSPWHISQTKIIEVKKEKNFSLSKELIESLIQKEEKDFINHGLNKYPEVFGKDKDVEIIDRKIIQTKLNGYIVNNPINKKVKTVEMSIFMGFISKKITKKISQIISEVFHINELYMHSFTLPSFLTLRDIFEMEDNFIFIDVSGEVTDISFVKEDVLRETQSFPIGRNSFIKKIMDYFGVSHKIAISILETYTKGLSDEKTKIKIEKTLEDLKKEWLGFLENSMFDLSKGAILPRTIFLTTDNDIEKVISETIKQEKFVKLVFPGYNKRPNIILINSDKTDFICEFGDNTEKDVFTCIEAFFLNKIFV